MHPRLGSAPPPASDPGRNLESDGIAGMDEDTDEVAEGPGVWATLDGPDPATTTFTHTSTVTVDADLVAIGLAAVFGLAVGVVVGRAAR